MNQFKMHNMKENKKTERITIRATSNQKERLKEKAKENDITLTQLLLVSALINKK